jgi:NAD-dependent deacetylase
MSDQNKISRVVNLLENAKSIFFITGSGISADSGLPTYRGVSGLYNSKITEEGLSIETALSGETLRSNPELSWKYIYQIEEKCRGATFNRGHRVIMEMEQHFERVWVLTQNVDGFHRASGSKNVINIHGDIHHLICPDCSWQEKVENYSTLSIPPTCPVCHAIVRPDVVLFGEMLSEKNIQILQKELEKEFDIYFSIGTTSVFPYIMQPILIAKHMGRPTVEINPGQSQISQLIDIKINLGAAEALDRIWRQYLSSIE